MRFQSWRNGDKKLILNGCGLCHSIEKAPRKGGYYITINVITPYCPITSDGKAPDLSKFVDHVMAAVASAMNKAHREAPKDNKLSQKDVVLNNLDDVIADVSGERTASLQRAPDSLSDAADCYGGYWRGTTDSVTSTPSLPTTKNENGEIPKMYREPRGSIYHPHLT